MNYSDLTKIQKRCIDAFIQLRPELANASTITRQEVEEMFFTLYEQRNSGGPKIGSPMWLIKGNKVGRGEYVFPAPNVNTGEVHVTSKKTSEEDEEFLAELRANGIDV